MKTKTIFLIAVGTATVSLLSFTANSKKNISEFNHYRITYPNGAPMGTTGAPGDQKCTLCHFGTPIANSSAIGFNFSGITNKYTPGSTYSITVSISGGSPRNGFEIVALRDSDNSSVGNWTITTPLNTREVSGNSRNYVTHTNSGSSQSSWSFNWTAPPTGEGGITFYIAGLVANNNGSSTGDETHLNKFTIQEDVSNAIIEQADIIDIDNSLSILNQNNDIIISLEAKNDNVASISILDLNGKSVYNSSYNLTKGKNTLTPINVENLSKGIYIVNITFNNQVIGRKIVL